jgi:menaquinone-specific isochorismate synthase
MNPDALAESVAPLRVTSRTRRIADVDALAVLDAADGDVRFYWAEDGVQVVGIGAGIVVTADGPDRVRTVRARTDAIFANVDHTAADDVPPDARPRVFGGFAFDDRTPREGRWDAFAGACFILPKRQILWTPDGAFETVNDVTGADPESTHKPTGRPTRSEAPEKEREHWDRCVQTIVQQLEDGTVGKVVLARAERRPARHHLARVLERLATVDDPMFRFLVEPAPGHAFYGATPEILVRLEDRRLVTTALAGSMPRGQTPAEDSALGRILMSSAKDSLEHELVVSYMLEHLANAQATQIQHHPRRLLKLSHVQHLETPIEAIVPEGTHVLDLVKRFHPTPAVGGIPRDASLALIRRLETFSRGWYAGAVGWFDAAGHGVFATAIRSALTTPEATWLFAGAGIVAGSNPEAEWKETEIKLRLMDQALTEADDE